MRRPALQRRGGLTGDVFRTVRAVMAPAAEAAMTVNISTQMGICMTSSGVTAADDWTVTIESAAVAASGTACMPDPFPFPNKAD